MTHVPTSLITEIHAGNCVAFVGAGFSATVIPPWGKLLSELARSSTTDIQHHVTSQVRKGSAHALDEAAQVLQDHLGEDAFLDLLASLLTKHDERPETGLPCTVCILKAVAKCVFCRKKGNDAFS